MGYWKTLIHHLDEALRIVELRRYRRMLAAGRLPVVYTIGIFMTAWMLVPFFFGTNGLLAGRAPIDAHRSWWIGILLTTCALAAGLGGYLRSQHLWHQERQLRTFHTWLLTYQDPVRVAITAVFMASLLGIALSGFPIATGVLLSPITGMGPLQLLLILLLTALCALCGAAVGAAVFFISYNLVPRRLYYPGLVVLATLAACMWLRMENVDGGWRRPWEEHPPRMARALTLITPVPVVFGIAAPHWWDGYAPPSLGLPVRAWQGGLLYGGFLLLAAGYCTILSVVGYLRLREDPLMIEEKPRAVTEEAGQEFYWKGFKNPVWTRDIRTRLRSKDTAEFIFFASIAVAAGAFVPLILTASDLSDPLQTARAARQVFFWLTMTLVGLVALVSPGLTADVITAERAMGTLEMLVGTPLRPREILSGKLLGAVSVMLLLISPSLPLFGLCYLFHGASGPQVLQVYLLLLITLTVSSFIGLAQSSINSRSGAAKFWAYAITACFLAIPGGPFWVAAAVAAPDATFRQSMGSQLSVAALITVIWAFVLVLFWGNACEQLEYSEY
jgi:hypothetical protein